MKRGAKWAIGITAGAVLVAGGVGVSEIVMREVVPHSIEDQVREFLKLSPDHPVEVTIHGSQSAQLVTGSFDRVQVSVPDAPLPGGLRADLYAEATDFPVNPAENELGETVVGARFSEQQLVGVLALFSRGIGQEIEIEQSHLKVTHTVSLFGQRIPLSLSLAPSVNDGALHVAPVAIDAGPFTLTAEQVAGIPVVNKLVEGMDICVADRIPRGVTLTSIELSSTRVFTAEASIDSRIGIDPQLRELGTC